MNPETSQPEQAGELQTGKKVTATVYFKNNGEWLPALDKDGDQLRLTGLITNNITESTVSILPGTDNKIDDDPHSSRGPVVLPLGEFEQEGTEYRISFKTTSHSDTSTDPA